jgi:hypothetical protein
MISESSLKGLGHFFLLLSFFAITPFRWNTTKLWLETRSLNSTKRKWRATVLYFVFFWVNNFLLLGKNAFLGYFMYFKLIPEGEVASIVLQMIFMMTYFCASFHNALFWWMRSDVSNLFKECCVFNRSTHGMCITIISYFV